MAREVDLSYLSEVPLPPDPVERPSHYAGDGKVECMDAMASMAAGYDRADVPAAESYWCITALKYLWRWPLKNGRQDLLKARQCLEYAIDVMAAGKPSE